MAAIPGAGLLSKFFGRAASEGAGVAFGFATAPVLVPALELLRQTAWETYPNRIPEISAAATGLAQGKIDRGDAQGWAHKNGYPTDILDVLVSIATSGMPLGNAYDAWRRGHLTDTEFETQLQRAAISGDWWAAMESLKDRLLEPGEIAKAVHRGIMPDDGLLVTAPPTTPGKVPMVPPSSLDSVAEAAAFGVTKERLRILVGNAGLPPGIVQMLQLVNRGVITEDDFLRGVGESNLRNEWGPFILALARRLLTPREYAEADLRGVLTHDAASAGAALAGLEGDDYEVLFETVGRPLNVHAITTGLARGGTYGGTYADIPEPYRDAVRRSNIRPEYAVLAHANRYSIPSYFILRAILQDGGMTEADFADYGKQLGWPPDLADAAAKAIAGGSTTTTDTHVTKAQTQLWGTTHRSYVATEIGDTEARNRLTTLGVPDDAQAKVIALWQAERELVRAQLTPAQIKKAVGEKVTNPATGVAWSEADATTALVDRGYSNADAATFLAE